MKNGLAEGITSIGKRIFKDNVYVTREVYFSAGLATRSPLFSRWAVFTREPSVPGDTSVREWLSRAMEAAPREPGEGPL
jgi:hypothetical protein